MPSFSRCFCFVLWFVLFFLRYQIKVFFSPPLPTLEGTLFSRDKDRMKLNISLVYFILHHVASVVITRLRFTFRESA